MSVHISRTHCPHYREDVEGEAGNSDTPWEEKFSHKPTAVQLQGGQVRSQYLSKLPQKLNKCSFAKGVSKTCVESKCRVILGEDGNPSFLKGEKKRSW